MKFNLILSKIIIAFIAFYSVLVVNSLKLNRTRTSNSALGVNERNKKAESNLLECTQALNSWSYFSKTSILKLLDDEFEKKAYIYFLHELIPQIETLDSNYNICKLELSKYDIFPKNETGQFKLEIKSKGEEKMVFDTKDSVRAALERLSELKNHYELLNEAKKLILNFDPSSICLECKLFSSQMALISILKRLRIMYESYILEVEKSIDSNILEELDKEERKNLR
ncbi:hypothetical protein HWI79_1296 [Cryptosporidium felis]|nr:hypothetical protein HWI79_1296 [Cryptosporidium felis]